MLATAAMPWCWSKDKGFDPLLRHLNKEGLTLAANSPLELDPTPRRPKTPTPSAIDCQKTDKKRAASRKLKTLTQTAAAFFPEEDSA